RPTTSFGGGKTHGLTAVYHLAGGARPANITEFIDPSLLPDGAVQVAALVGDALDPTAGVETDGHRTFTLWGEMAAQIGDDAFSAMAVNDVERTAPGTGTIKAAFSGKPTIVIVDEIAKYLRAVSSSGSEDVRRMARAIRCSWGTCSKSRLTQPIGSPSSLPWLPPPMPSVQRLPR